MPMDVEDERYFDGKFGSVHKRITESEQAQMKELHLVTTDQNRKITEIRTAIEAHKLESNTFHNAAAVAAADAARKAMEEHLENSRAHNPLKMLGFLAVFFAVCGSVWGVVLFFVKVILPAISK